jgi:hypothetical protein
LPDLAAVPGQEHGPEVETDQAAGTGNGVEWMPGHGAALDQVAGPPFPGLETGHLLELEPDQAAGPVFGTAGESRHADGPD